VGHGNHGAVNHGRSERVAGCTFEEGPGGAFRKGCVLEGAQLRRGAFEKWRIPERVSQRPDAFQAGCIRKGVSSRRGHGCNGP
jgi:hypothetical protein